MKYGGGNFIWGLAALGPEQLTIIKEKVNSRIHQGVLQDNVRVAVTAEI